MPGSRAAALLAVAAVFCAQGISAAAEPWATPQDQERLVAEIKTFFSGAETRLPGSPGNLAVEQRVAERFAASGFTNGAITFRAPAFVPGPTSLTVENQPPVRLFPLLPTIFRPGNFEEKEFSAPLVYLGRGEAADLERVKGNKLEGALALMEFDCGSTWLRILRFGVKGIIFIEPEEYEHTEAVAKVYASEARVPRFLVESEPGLRLKTLASSKTAPVVRVQAEPSRWQNGTLRDLWALIPGSDPTLEREVAVIMAPMDSNCIVPEKSYGASGAADLYMLLQLLEKFREAPPKRSVLLVAVNASTQNHRGERMLAWHLLSDQIEVLRALLNEDRRQAQQYVHHYSQLNLDKFNQKDEDLLISWRRAVDNTTGMDIILKNPLVAFAKRDVTRVKMEQIRLFKQQLPEEEYVKRRAALETEKKKYVHVLTLFNKVGVKTKLSDLKPEETAILGNYVRQVLALNQTNIFLNQHDLEADLQNSAVREHLQGRKIAVVLSLAMDWSSPMLGFATTLRASARWAVRWGANTVNLAGQISSQNGDRANLLADTLTIRGGLLEHYYFYSKHEQDGGVACFHTVAELPAFKLMNAFPGPRRAFLPSDNFDALAKSHVAEQTVFLGNFIGLLLDTDYVTSPAELPPVQDRNKLEYRALRIKTFKYDELSATVLPDIPVGGSVVVMVGGEGYNLISGNVINADVELTDSRGTALLYGLPYGKFTKWTPDAFHMDADFLKVDHAIDAGDAFKRLNPEQVTTDMVLALFECREYPLSIINDSSMVSDFSPQIDDIMPLTAKGNAAPRKFGFTGLGSAYSSKMGRINGPVDYFCGPASFFFEKDDRFKLITSQKRVALNADEKAPEGRGFSKPADLLPDWFFVVIRDLSVLNHYRLKKLGTVAGDLMKEFLERGDECMARMRKALAASDHNGYLLGLYEGLGAQVKSYEQGKETTDDMLKAVVVYMALLLPFCLFVEKLLFNFVKIEHEMAAFAGLFVITFLIFRLIHPAFRIAQAAEMIFIAFIMAALALFVISILRSRFEGEMQLLFRSYLSGGMDEAVYSTVTQKAMMIGVNNMKRRRIRTTLTTVTIVLIAFTMLSFTSVSKKVNPTLVLRAKDTPYHGFMYHWPNNKPLDDATLTVIKDLFAGHGTTAVRYWLVADDNVPFPITSDSGVNMQAEGILGLSVVEEGFIGKMPLVAGNFFTSDDASEVIVSASAAEALGMDAGNLKPAALNFRGRRLNIVGIFDDTQFRSMLDLNGMPLTPIQRFVMEEDVKVKHTSRQQTGSRKGFMKDIQDLGAISFVDTTSLLILPSGLARKLGARPFSVSLKMKPEDAVWPLADLLLTSTDARFYMSSLVPFTTRIARGGEKEKHKEASAAPGIYYVGSSYSTSVGGLSVLLVPLLIASTIILNTMLGSVHERKKEIAVYNAIGLNPHHIGMFFLAESFVYGVIGSVGGYLIGQVLSAFLSYTGLVKGLNFNYSSLSVAYVILFTIVVVLLSTLYPAAVATKAAVPSGKRTWSLPKHDGCVMSVIFPFVYQPSIASGILSYLQEYFDRFTGASIGDFISTFQGRICEKDVKQRDCYRLKYHVALVPFDLGVTQHLQFDLAFDDYVQAYRLNMRIERVSGQDSNWVTTNRPFLEHLRKYLMRWRNLDLAQQTLYVRQSVELMNRS